MKAVVELTEIELGERLLAAPGSPLYAAIVAVIDLDIIQLVSDALDPKLPEAELRFLLGGVGALNQLKEGMEGRIQEALERKAEMEKAKREV